MRDHLHSLAQIITPPLFLQNGQINPPTGEIIKLGEFGMGKPLVMAKVQIRFGPIIQHVYFTMLEGTHGSRIHIEIRIKFLEGNLQSTRLEQGAQRSRRKPLAKGTDYTACQKNILHLLEQRLHTLHIFRYINPNGLIFHLAHTDLNTVF